ncbi:MAG: hypothetical protein K0R99_3425 [Microbacterium sp.]|jgi:hypothetical protein|uniref:hypothetical protein n=1 Tax=Microbacterium sp. TaxID=51671 RepID=UPI002609D04F|nr:hypothetical protein [Microbacterium sp.]MDF2561979.1 hypothetical protein [Microbacterium sp.]
MTAASQDTRHGRRSYRNPWRSAARRLDAFVRDDTGDVPGWVLVTLMTAGLVVLIWAVAGPALTALFEQAIQRVSGL